MRVRTAKQRAQRIDLSYFKRSHGMRRWRIGLSIALPLAAALWVAGVGAAGNRKPYSAGPLSRSHAFAESRCELCHAPASATAGFRAHTTDTACLKCHDAPTHAANQTAPPPCSACHLDHRGRIELARVDDQFCVECHAVLRTAHGEPGVARTVRQFPSGHPEFAAVRPGAQDPGRLKFNHAVHMKDTLRGPAGAETLECTTCHTPEVLRTATKPKKPPTAGQMAPVSYQRHCARCHPLFFDARIDRQAPHEAPETVRRFVQQALGEYARQNPAAVQSDNDLRRVPLNFPRPAQPPARTSAEWIARRAAFDEQILWNKTCSECHERTGTDDAGLPFYARSNMTKQWMPRAAFDHTPHAMVKCGSCHAAQASIRTSDVLLPGQAVCATCHAPSKGAESRCFECHRYHDWTRTRPVPSAYTLTDFK